MLQSESELSTRSGEVALSIAPHFYRRCPAGHEVRHIDADYPVRCQEWLLHDRMLVSVSGPAENNRALCSCTPMPPAISREIEHRKEEVGHRLDGQRLTTMVRFSYPVEVCSECSKPRSIADDFAACWKPLTEIPRR